MSVNGVAASTDAVGAISCAAAKTTRQALTAHRRSAPMPLVVGRARRSSLIGSPSPDRRSSRPTAPRPMAAFVRIGSQAHVAPGEPRPQDEQRVPAWTQTLSIKTIFGQDRQYLVPLFQRPYVWNQVEQWEPLWEDVRSLADRTLARQASRIALLGRDRARTGAQAYRAYRDAARRRRSAAPHHHSAHRGGLLRRVPRERSFRRPAARGCSERTGRSRSPVRFDRSKPPDRNDGSIDARRPHTMRTLVIGGTQFIGRAIVERLLARGHDVAILHRRDRHDLGPEVRNLQADRGDLARVTTLLGRERFEAIFDLRTTGKPARQRTTSSRPRTMAGTGCGGTCSCRASSCTGRGSITSRATRWRRTMRRTRTCSTRPPPSGRCSGCTRRPGSPW